MKKPGLAAWLGSHYPWPRTNEIAGSNPASPTKALCVQIHVAQMLSLAMSFAFERWENYGKNRQVSYRQINRDSRWKRRIRETEEREAQVQKESEIILAIRSDLGRNA